MAANPGHAAARERARWRRYEAEDQARWEGQLRRLANHSTGNDAPVAVSPLPVLVTVLQVVGGMMSNDALVIARSLPVLSGNEADDLLCGRCDGVIGSRISPE